jgi:triosephosphate isomerase (TIM)
MVARKKIIAANWKMNHTHREAKSYADLLWAEVGVVDEIEVVLIPPFTAIPALAEAVEKKPVARLGAQNMHWEKSGAFTGEISATMLRALDVNYVVLGHSERRRLFGETDEIVNRKITAALNAGLRPIFCVGETLAERDDKRVEEILKRQIHEGLKGVNSKQFHDLVIAYEPLWAIGTGRTAAPEQAEQAHAFIRSGIASVSDDPTADKFEFNTGAALSRRTRKNFCGNKTLTGR